MSSTATDDVPAASTSADDTSAEELQDFDFDTYKGIITSFPRTTTDLTNLANSYHATLSSQGHKDLAAQALRDLLFRSRHELDMAKQLDRISTAIGPEFKLADWLPDDGALRDETDATLQSRVDLVRRDGTMGLQGSWLIANLLNPIRKLFASCYENFTKTRRHRKSLDTAKAKLVEVHMDHNNTETRWRGNEEVLKDRVRRRQNKLDTATNTLAIWGNCIRQNNAYIGALWHVVKSQQHRAVSESEYREIVRHRALARARRPRVIKHSQNLNLVVVTTLPAGGCMVRLSLRQRITALYGYVPGRSELAVKSGPPDGPGFVAELNGEEHEGGDVVRPTSNYAASCDDSREAWLDWFHEAL